MARRSWAQSEPRRGECNPAAPTCLGAFGAILERAYAGAKICPITLALMRSVGVAGRGG